MPRPVDKKTATPEKDGNTTPKKLNLETSANTPTPPNSPTLAPANPGPDMLPLELTAWQAKILKTSRRTPLPNAPNSRPWIGMSATALDRAINKAQNKAKLEKRKEDREKKAAEEAAATATARKVWKKDDIERLAEMRAENKSWDEIQAVFPTRTKESLKQVWFKHHDRAKKVESLRLLTEKHGKDAAKKMTGGMDLDEEAFDKDGKVKWNLRRK